MAPRNLKLVALLTIFAACGDGGSIHVIDAAAWLAVQPDPLDPSQTCAEAATRLEEGLVEIDTTLCNHVTLNQPSLLRLREGDVLDLFAFHSALSAPEPAQGRMALWLDDVLVWEALPDIPSSEVIYLDTVVTPQDFSRGVTVQLHISNHGGNSWRFVSLKRP
jgi:hypothetical protein